MQPGGDYRIRPLAAEFSLSAVEHRFRVQAAPDAARHASAALSVAALFFLIFGYTDYLTIGANRITAYLIAARVVVSTLMIAVALRLRGQPLTALGGTAVSLVELLAVVTFYLICLYRPGDIMLHGMSMLVMLLGVYLFIPNRFIPALAVALISTAGFIALLMLTAEMKPGNLATLVMLLALCNTFGALAAHRFSYMRREEYGLLETERETNRLLGYEIGERRRLQEELSQMARIDPLTGLLNRRHYLELSNLAVRRMHRLGYPASVIFMDVDRFKHINDSHGHAAGDEALRAVARVCRETLRDVDVLGRFGGEEFAITLPRVALDEAMAIAERIRARLEALSITTPNGPFGFTVSMGVAEATADATHVTDALNAADRALYRGKNSGRNRVVSAGPEPGPDQPSEVAPATRSAQTRSTR